MKNKHWLVWTLKIIFFPWYLCILLGDYIHEEWLTQFFYKTHQYTFFYEEGHMFARFICMWFFAPLILLLYIKLWRLMFPEEDY